MQQQHVCRIISFNEILLCIQKQCLWSKMISCIECFNKKHLGPQSSHTCIKFNQSLHFINFEKLRHFENVINRKMNKNLNEQVFNMCITTQIIFNNSFVIEKLFNRSIYAVDLYFKLKKVKYGELLQVMSGTTFDLMNALSKTQNFNFQVYFKHLKNKTKEEQFQTIQLNKLLGSTTQPFQKFIYEEQKYLQQYCLQLIESNQNNFDISAYIKQRCENKQKYTNNAVYFTKQFTAFLFSKYKKNNKQNSIFTLKEYYNNFWQYFNLFISSLKQLQKYFDSEYNFYQNYSTLMENLGIEQSLFGFRIWRLNNCPQNQINLKQNRLFIQIFIIGYIQAIIEQKKFDQESKIQNWHKFISYIKDYIELIQNQQFLKIQQKQIQENKSQNNYKKLSELFDMNIYQDYYNFRIKRQQFLIRLKKKSQIVYNEKNAVQFLNYCFIRNITIQKVSSYQKYMQNENLKKQQILKIQIKKAEQLKQQLLKQQEQQYNQYIVGAFFMNCTQNNIDINRKQYDFFKSQLLKNYDLTYLKMQNEYLMQQNRSLSQQPQKMENQVNKQISEQLMQICPCCKNNPDNCKNSVCQFYGYCVICND